MALSIDDVHRIAHLARIAIDDAEATRTLRELDGVFRLIEEMQAVDTTGVDPMSHAQDLVLRLRDDKVTERDERSRLQAVAPAVESGLYLVPRVVE
jgi:aspartyl-tRNA(Asn)/glutamyl-tRNA(Gln) amidotransferase subunit C